MTETKEIEVTDAMLAAGAEVMAGYDPAFDTLESIAHEVFMAMSKASRAGSEAQETL